MIQIQFLWSFYCQKKSHKKRITFMYIAVTHQDMGTTAFVSEVFTFGILYQKIYMNLRTFWKDGIAVSAIFVSPYILKTAKRQFYCLIMRRYFSLMHQKKGSGRALGVDPFFRDGLCFFLFFSCILFYDFDFVYYWF